jgi:hypothetical protein
MSMTTSAAARATFGEVMTAHQTVAANTPAVATAQKFAEYLKEKQPANTTTTTTSGFAPTPEQLAKSLFGSAYDPETKTVRLDKLAGETAKRTAEFAERLAARLSTASIDQTPPIELSVGLDGRIIVDSTHPQAAQITKLFEDDSALAQAYRNIAAQNDHLATLQAGAAYVKEWNGAKTDAERQMIWNRYGTLMERLSSMFSGRMTFGTAGAIVESQQILRRMDLA